MSSRLGDSEYGWNWDTGLAYWGYQDGVVCGSFCALLLRRTFDGTEYGVLLSG